MTMRSGNDREQLDAMLVLTVDATPAAKRLAERLVRRRDADAGVDVGATEELLSMLGIGEGAA